jgi:hypothetical protein
MNRSLAIMCGRQSVAGTVVPIRRRLMIIGAVPLVAAVVPFAQNSDLQQRLAAVKQAVPEYKHRHGGIQRCGDVAGSDGGLPNGTNYSKLTILNASAKQLVVTATNSNYQKLGGTRVSQIGLLH